MTTTGVETVIPLVELGESVTEATVTRWLKQPGDTLAADEPLLEVSTDKVDTEVVTPVAGTLVRILAAEGEVVAVGDALAVVAKTGTIGSAVSASESADDKAVSRDSTTRSDVWHDAQERESVVEAAVGTASPTPLECPEPALAPPQDDSAPKAAPSTCSTTEKLPRIRQVIARRMLESLQTSAQLTTVVEVDVTAVADIRNRYRHDFLAQTGVKLSFLPFFVRAAVGALAEHRVVNSSLNLDATEVTYHRGCHLGMAVDSPKGLMVPVIRNSQNLSVSGLARSIADLAERVRKGSIKPEELSGGTFTITNTGSRGALFDTPIINQPQSAILGLGTVVERVVPSRVGCALQLGVRSMAYFSLSYDHRIVDGADAARYLGTVKAALEQPISTIERWI